VLTVPLTCFNGGRAVISLKVAAAHSVKAGRTLDDREVIAVVNASVLPGKGVALAVYVFYFVRNIESVLPNLGAGAFVCAGNRCGIGARYVFKGIVVIIAFCFNACTARNIGCSVLEVLGVNNNRAFRTCLAESNLNQCIGGNGKYNCAAVSGNIRYLTVNLEVIHLVAGVGSNRN